MSYPKVLSSITLLAALAFVAPSHAAAQGRSHGGGNGGSGGGHAQPRGTAAARPGPGGPARRTAPRWLARVVRSTGQRTTTRPYYQRRTTGPTTTRPTITPITRASISASSTARRASTAPTCTVARSTDTGILRSTALRTRSAAPYGYGYGGYSGQPYGGVRLAVPQRDAEVFVDGNFVGTVDNFDGSTQQANLEAGPHRIEVRQGRLRADGVRRQRRRRAARSRTAASMRPLQRKTTALAAVRSQRFRYNGGSRVNGILH